MRALIAIIDCLSCHVINYVVAVGDVLVDLFSEVVAAQRTLSLDFEPLVGALRVEVVLRVAREGHNIVLRDKRDEANGTVWHIWVLLIVIAVLLLLQTRDVALQRELP